MNGKKRCKWCNLNNARYVEYHDSEWCKQNFDDRYLYEMLLLESFQAGLSWECILNKRHFFKKAYDDFDVNKVIAYGDGKINELLNNKDIIRNKRKINASIANSRIFKSIVLEYGSFYNYLKTFTKGEIYFETGKTTNGLSDAISADLQKRGMKFVGSVIIYSYLQAVGVIYSHEKDCFLYKNGPSKYTIKEMESEQEIIGKALVHYNSWRDTYSDLVDANYLNSMTYEKCAEIARKWRDNVLVAKDGDKVVGFVGYGDCRDNALPHHGEIIAIYVLEEYRGQRIGYALMNEAINRLNCKKIAVWVLKGNDKAIRFYERYGFKPDGAETEIMLGAPKTELRMVYERK